jgi:hypothetical protein
MAGEMVTPVQYKILTCDKRTVCGVCGRRVGKTFIGTRVISRWVHDDMRTQWNLLQAGERDRWAGESMSPVVAKEVAPDVLYWIVAPRDEHLAQIRGYLISLYAQNGTYFRHPLYPEFFTDRNRRFWLWHDGICGRIDFIPASSPTSMVSRGLHGAWVDESGFVPNDRYLAMRPTLWEHGGRLLATGTPTVGKEHWFTKLASSGLRPGEERYDPEYGEMNENVRTFIADTITSAYSKQARAEAENDAKFWGPIWAAQWIHADWRLRALTVFREWSQRIHVVRYNKTPVEMLHRPSLHRKPYCTINSTPIMENPNLTIGVVDWSYGTNPGAAIIALVWLHNPLCEKDTRPLVIQVEDHEGHEAYTSDGWWRILSGMDERWGVDKWIADPHAPRLIKSARKAGFVMTEGAHQDKLGRISLVAALIHHDQEEDIKPALYISDRCENTIREISKYRWAKNREGETKNVPIQHDDHTTDCLAMLAAEVYGGGSMIIGGQYFG